MPRSISVTRRKPNLVDLNIRDRPNILGFEFGAASNFDSAFSVFQTVLGDGMQKLDTGTPPRSVNVPVPGSQFRGLVRFVFDPDVYTVAVPAVKDSAPFFIRVRTVLPDGLFGAYEAMHLVMPYNPGPFRPIQLRGTAPAAVDLAHSLEIQLPMQCNSNTIMNDGTNDLFIAFESPGAEYRIQPVTTTFKTIDQYITSVSQIFVRGAGGGTTLNAIFTARNNPIGL